ncbi:MAG: MoaD/ThiS family protein [Candidatus Parvarchaeota archaeon]|nr:MoaD/ThiS family protein [Candidatus Jingweiarchaeum tengchongense]MCW1298582.1 MoaD/ThiS family protein [Candidatus Jingweiarchaeum tengchongense]MCW1300428.1 MoaD/ThiS family protein [Candidatus Jingweiarchaeum tengchongense]MCW1304606.1 MoaD/ThiS family protein [Candidatus Jingweiarchaeum tengchongense]MCW1306084.1 MoaD/ThiS family protein [Candidatus Jingweiarchaeum tengchongense]
MKVHILIFKSLGRKIEHEFEVEKKTKLIDLINKINAIDPDFKKEIISDENYLILINGRRADLKSEVKKNDKISFLPMISGG